MKKYIFSIVLFFAFSCGQYFAGETEKISIILSSNIEPYKQAVQGFREFFKENNETCIYEHIIQQEEDGQLILSQISDEKPNLILAVGTKALKFAKDKVQNTPVIFCMVLDLSKLKDMNATGVSMEILQADQISAVKKVLPNVKKISITYSSETVSIYEKILAACKGQQIQLIAEKVDTVKDFPSALENILWQTDCFFMIPDSKIYFSQSIKHLLTESLKKKVPVIGLSSTYTKAGALVSLDLDYFDIGKQAAEMALKVLKDGKSGELQVAAPRKTRLSLNIITAEKMEILIPQDCLNKNNPEVFGK